MIFLLRIDWVSLLDIVRNSEIQNSLNVESLLLRIERYQLKWFGYLSRMPQKSLPKQALFAISDDKMIVGPPWQIYMDHVEDLGIIAWGFVSAKWVRWWMIVMNLELLPPRSLRFKQETEVKWSEKFTWFINSNSSIKWLFTETENLTIFVSALKESLKKLIDLR